MNWESKCSKRQILVWWLLPDKTHKCVSKWPYFLKDLMHYVLRKEFEWMSWTEVGKKSDFTNISSSHSAIQHFFFFLVGAGGGGWEDGEGERRVGRTDPFLLFIHPLSCCQNILDIIDAYLMTKCKPNMAGYWLRSSVAYSPFSSSLN